MKKLILNNFKKLMSMMLTAILLLSTISFEVFAENPKISIIIPVYNTPENLLRDCLESAKNQTLKDIEIICVDDGSTDGSGKILDEYAKSDPKFVVVHQENGGVAVARDKGMDLAKGEYIQFLDSDDTIDPTTSEKCYTAAKEYDADIVKFPFCHASNFDKIEVLKPSSLLKYAFNLYAPIWNGIYRKKLLNDYNLRWDGLKGGGTEDTVFSVTCLGVAGKIVHIPNMLYKWHANSMSLTHGGLASDDKKRGVINNIKIMSEKLQSICLKVNDNVKSVFLGCLLDIKDWTSRDYKICFDEKEFISAIHPQLLKDDVVNRLPIAERIRLKSMIWRANPQAKSQKTIDDGIYTISSKLAPNMCLDINQCSKGDKANLQLWQKNGTDAQKFKVQYDPDGYYTMKAMCSGKFIDVANSGKKNGTNIWQYGANGTDAQKWFIVPDGDGYYFLLPRCNDFCMDVYGAQAKNGANIHCWYIHGDDNQRFKLEKCEDKPNSSKSNTAQKTAGKPRPKKPVKIRKKAYKPSETKKDAGKLSSSKPIDSKKSA